MARMLGNFFIGMNSNVHIPVKLFSTDPEALAWLRQFVPTTR